MADPVPAETERRDLEELEAVIEAGLQTFIEVGRALQEIKERELYKSSGYTSFADYTRERWGIGRHYAYRQIRASEAVAVLEDVDNWQHPLPANEAQARPLTSLEPHEQAEAWKAAVQKAGGEQPTSQQVKAAAEELENGTGDPSVHYSSDRSDWLTPDRVIDRVLRVLGTVDLDPCASDAEDPNVPARRHFTEDEDGLSRDWSGRVFLNPPYGNEIADWTAKLCRSYEDGAVEEAIALIPARTDTSWFRNFRPYPICFVRGRLRFSGHRNAAPFPSAVVYLGTRSDAAFMEAFGGPDGIGDVFTLAGS